MSRMQVKRLTLHFSSDLGNRGLLLPLSRSRLSKELMRYVSGGCSGGEGRVMRLRIFRTYGTDFAKLGDCCG